MIKTEVEIPMPLDPLAAQNIVPDIKVIAAKVDPEVLNWLADFYRNNPDANKKLLKLKKNPIAKGLL